MNEEFNIPWKRLALIAELTRRLDRPGYQFGKTVLEKMVYLMQEVFGVNFGYEFELYTYGPFTAELLSDLDLAEQVGVVAVNPVEAMSGGYEINTTAKTDDMIEKSKDTIQQISIALDNLCESFGKLNARELELRASIVYIEHSFRKKREELSKVQLKQILHEIKPKFTDEEVERAISELTRKDFISLN